MKAINIILIIICSLSALTAQTYVGGLISESTTWEYENSPYIVESHIYIKGTSNPVLTIESGVEVQFNSLQAMYVGDNSDPGLSGGLIADASGGDRIVFTRSGGTGNWNGIYFNQYSDDASCLLDSCDIRYGGSSTAYPAGIYCYSSSPVIRHCTIESSLYDGIYLNRYGSTGDSCLASVSNNTIRDNGRYGIFSNNAFCSPVVDNNVFEGNDSFPVRVYAHAVGKLTNNTFNNNNPDMIEVKGGTIAGDATWTDQGVPYIIRYAYGEQYIFVNGTDCPVLTIEPGVEVRFDELTAIFIGSNAPGGLIADGSYGDRIVFTRSGETGYWSGIRFNQYSDDASCLLDSCDIRYGGSSTAYPGIYCYRSSPVIRHCTIESSLYDGIYLKSDSETDICAPLISHCQISGNLRSGIYCSGTYCEPIVKNNVFTDDSTGIQLYSSPCTDSIRQNDIYDCLLGACNQYPTVSRQLTEHFWGDSLGPYHNIFNPQGGGVPITNGITFDPWLASEVNPVFAIQDVSITVTTINPNNPAYSTTEIKATTTDVADWRLTFLDTLGNTVRQFTDTGSLIEVSWDGINSSGVMVPNGLYYYHIAAISQADETAASVLGRVFVGEPIAIITSPEDNDVFLYDSICIYGSAWCLDFKHYKIFYALDSEPYNWQEIVTSYTKVSNNLLAVWEFESLANDTYNIKLEVTDSTDNVAYDTVFHLILDRLWIENIVYDATAFIPQDSESLEVTFDINHDAYVTAYVFQGYDGTELVKTIPLGNISAGSDTFYWNGTDDSRSIVSFGDYRLEINAYDDLGRIYVFNSQTTDPYVYYWGTANCEYIGVFVRETSGTGKSGNTAFRFASPYGSGGNGINGPVRIGGKVLSGNYDPPPYGSCFINVATIRHINLPPQGRPFEYYWDFRDDNGALVEEGYYCIYWDGLDDYNNPANNPLPVRTIIVGAYEPLAESLRVEPRLILGNDGVIEVQFIPRWDGNVSISVKKNTLPITTLFSGSVYGGVMERIEWNGKNSDDIYVSEEGEYTIEIESNANGFTEIEMLPVFIYR